MTIHSEVRLSGDPRGDDHRPPGVGSVHRGVTLTLDVLRDTYTVCKLPPDADIPAWASRGGGGGGGGLEFSAVMRTRDELSIVRPQRSVPNDLTTRNDGWRGLRLRGPIDLGTSGVLAAVLLPLASAQVPAFPIATFDTDYVFVPAAALDRAIESLEMVGHTVHR